MQMRIKKISLILLVSFCLAYLGVALVSRLIVSEVLMPKLQAVSANVASYHEQILNDLKLLDVNPIFPTSPRKHDAQDFISQRIGWKDEKVESPPTPMQEKLIALKMAHPNLREGENMKKLADDPQTGKIDVSWVDQLESYDHWNLASSSIVKAQLGRVKVLNGIERIEVLATMPMPDYELFRFAALVRFLQLQKSGDPLKGLRLLRHSSYLSHTTPVLVGAMIATAGLGREHALVKTFDIADWTLIEKERIAAYKRVSWAWGGLIHEASWGTLPEEFLMFMKPHNSVCAMAGENALGSGLQDFLAPTVLFETNFSAQLKQSESITRKLFDVCSTPEYSIFLEPSPESSNSLFKKSHNSSWWVSNGSIDEVTTDKKSIGINPARIPFVRRIFGLTFLTVGTISSVRLYEDLNSTATDSATQPTK